MSGSEPLARSTRSERALVRRLNAANNRDEVLAELKANLQPAIELELATLQVNLFRCGPLVRNKTLGKTIGPAQLLTKRSAA